MWLLNIRGFDIKYNPLAYSYLLVAPSEVHLFMDKADDEVRNVLRLYGKPRPKYPRNHSEMREYLESEGLTLHPYSDAYDFMTQWYEQQTAANKQKPRVFVPTTTNYLFGEIFASSAVVEGSPVQVMKGVKNAVELEGMRNSHIRDSAALISFLMWLEGELLEGRSYSEIELASKIDSMRAAMDKYVDLR
ncbi:class II MHC-associated invariant chain trimerization domain protein [Teladorsagia circumcincta]|uniref:Class II MHC-associated invariant chain trimerization domain protein n=1 Tax=Teladorsagia circumcincta TaxID=45464 RepID=A0A2G9TYL7_TELCI|nr:class II MHC-associated invariant chain trimerization domain protein [Teladorsagia circumcincta]